MIRTILLFVLLFSSTCFAQTFINKSQQQVMRLLAKYETGAGFDKPVIEQHDSTISMLVKGSGGIQTLFTYRFDGQQGKCKVEEVKASCDSCYKKYLEQVLAQKKYQWKKINENQYISSYAKKRLIELPAENNDFSYMILKTGWTKKLYRMLTGQQ